MKKLGIVCAGGTAPAINSVIRSVVISARNSNLEVLGFIDGFYYLSKIHLTGGSIIGISREKSTDEEVENSYRSLIKSNIDYLVSIGGDGTATMIYKISKLDRDRRIKFAHIPKTIDNDFPLPPNSRTFGFETARNLGMELVLNLLEDAKALKRWFFVQVMGRNAGHLALGIGKSAGATLTLIPEEFQEYEKIPIEFLVDILEGSIIKRLAYGKNYGLAILAEGLALKLDEYRPSHYSLSEFPLSSVLANKVEESLKSRGIEIRIIPQNIGYVLRTARPIAFDIAYTITLGHSAVKLLTSDNPIHCAVITLKGDKIEAVSIDEFIENDRIKIRYVDIDGEVYRAGYEHMIRSKKEDFENLDFLKILSEKANLSLEDFIRRFKYTTQFPKL